MMSDLIDRQAAIDALWKALYEYEDKTEKQFQESDELDIGDWILHRIFVQNMSDIDRQTILNLPSAQTEKRTETHGVCLDAISRQMAIDSIQHAGKIGKQTCIGILKRMPSAQPEIIRCKDCKYWQTDDGTFPDFDGRPWHECKCLYMFRAPDGEPARTTADFWCGYGERGKENE